MKNINGSKIDFFIQCVVYIPTALALLIACITILMPIGRETLIFGMLGHFFVGVVHLIISLYWGVIRNIKKTGTYFQVALLYVIVLIASGYAGLLSYTPAMITFLFVIPQMMALYYFIQSYTRINELQRDDTIYQDRLIYSDILD